MLAEEIRASVQREVDEAWHKGNLDVLDELYSADFVRHSPPPFGDIEGLESFKEQIADTRTVYPDFRVTIDEIIVEGDRAAGRWTIQGTHKGQSTLLPIPPTGKQVTGSGCTVSHIEDGKIVEQWFYPDNLGFLQQLGVVPPLDQPGG